MIQIKITISECIYTLEFDSPEELYEQRITCKYCGLYCGGLGFYVVHLADNCSESATKGKLIERLELFSNDDDEVEKYLDEFFEGK